MYLFLNSVHQIKFSMFELIIKRVYFLYPNVEFLSVKELAVRVDNINQQWVRIM